MTRWKRMPTTTRVKLCVASGVCLVLNAIQVFAPAVVALSTKGSMALAPGAASERLRELETELQHSQVQDDKHRTLGDVLGEIKDEQTANDARRRQRLREAQEALDRSLAKDVVAEHYSGEREDTTRKRDSPRLILAFGLPLLGLWIMAKIVGVIVKGRRVDTQALLARLQSDEDADAVAESIITSIPRLERQLRHGEALCLLKDLAKRLSEHSEHRTYVDGEIRRLSEVKGASGNSSSCGTTILLAFALGVANNGCAASTDDKTSRSAQTVPRVLHAVSFAAGGLQLSPEAVGKKMTDADLGPPPALPDGPVDGRPCPEATLEKPAERWAEIESLRQQAMKSLVSALSPPLRNNCPVSTSQILKGTSFAFVRKSGSTVSFFVRLTIL